MNRMQEVPDIDATKKAVLAGETSVNAFFTAVKDFITLAGDDGDEKNTVEHLTDLNSKLEALKRLATTEKTKITSMLDGVQFKGNDAANEKRKDCTILRHARDRLVKPLTSANWNRKFADALKPGMHALISFEECGGCSDKGNESAPVGMSEDARKLLGSQLLTLRKDSEVFNENEVAVWSKDSPMMAFLVAYVHNSGEKLTSKCSAADTAMLQNPKWNGAQGRIDWYAGKNGDTPAPGPIKIGSGELDVSGKACDAWLCTLRKNMFRTGSAATVLNGMRSFSHCIAEPMFALIFPVQALLDKGISMIDYAQYMATNDGQTFINLECKLVRLTRGQTLYIPFGFGVQWIYLANDAVKKPGCAQWSHIWVVTDWGHEQPADPRVAYAIRDYNAGYLTEKASTHEAFKPRKERFDECFATV